MTRRALLVSPVRAVAAAAAVLALAALLASCGEAEEELGLGPTLPPAAASPSGATSPTQTPRATAATPPADWVEYTNKDLGFSLYHPPQFAPDDLSTASGPNRSTANGLGRHWVIIFVDPESREYGAVVAVYENTERLSLAEWTRNNICDPAGPQKGGQPVDIAGRVGLFCWVEELDGQYSRHLIFEQGDRIFDLQAPDSVADTQFQALVRSFQLLPGEITS